LPKFSSTILVIEWKSDFPICIVVVEDLNRSIFRYFYLKRSSAKVDYLIRSPSRKVIALLRAYESLRLRFAAACPPGFGKKISTPSFPLRSSSRHHFNLVTLINFIPGSIFFPKNFLPPPHGNGWSLRVMNGVKSNDLIYPCALWLKKLILAGLLIIRRERFLAGEIFIGLPISLYFLLSRQHHYRGSIF
jgi:hypothetical protein